MNNDENCNDPHCWLIREGIKHIHPRDRNLEEYFELLDSEIQNYVMEYYFNWRQKELSGSIKEDKGNVVGYVQGTIDSAEELRVSLKDIQHLSIIQVFKKFGFSGKDFQITDSLNSPIGYLKSKALHWNSFLLKDLVSNDLIKIEFGSDQMLVKSSSGKTIAKCVFEEMEKPKKKMIEKFSKSNPIHYSCFISVLEPSVGKKYIFEALLFYLGKKHLEFYLNGGDLPAG